MSDDKLQLIATRNVLRTEVNDNDRKGFRIACLERKIIEKDKQIEGLKCCGNCKRRYKIYGSGEENNKCDLHTKCKKCMRWAGNIHPDRNMDNWEANN
jgi:hypothetical protein